LIQFRHEESADVVTRLMIPLATLALLEIFSGSGCSKREARQAPSGPPEVQVIQAVQQDVPVIKEWVGSLDGSINVQVQARVTGYLISQNYREGDLVKKDSLLFQIDPRPFQAALAQTRAALAQAKADQYKTGLDATRFTELYAKRAVSQQERDNAVLANAAAQAQVKAQEAAVEQAQLNLGFTKIQSPIDGIAGTATVNLGDLVSAGTTTLTRISKVNPIKAYWSLSEQEYLRAAPKLEARATTPENQRKPYIQLILANGQAYPYLGDFDYTERQVNERTGTIQIAATFPNPTNLLRPGQFARVRIPVNIQKGALMVPQRAVNELQGTYQLAVVGPDNKAQIRAVQVGERIGSMWVIDEGLKPGERVVVEGLQKVRDGAPVIARPWTPPAQPSPSPSNPRPGAR
jgi:membrane fusion protein (multidrug efflux system)